MDHVPGVPLFSRGDGFEMGPRGRYTTLVDLLRTLNALHSYHVHSAVLPANIILRESDGFPVLVDFGVARLAHLRRLFKMGTRVSISNWSAPELAYGKVTQAADIYGVGMVALATVLQRSDPWCWLDLSIPAFVSARLQERGESSHFATLLAACVQTNPMARPSVATALALLKDACEREAVTKRVVDAPTACLSAGSRAAECASGDLRPAGTNDPPSGARKAMGAFEMYRPAARGGLFDFPFTPSGCFGLNDRFYDLRFLLVQVAHWGGSLSLFVYNGRPISREREVCHYPGDFFPTATFAVARGRIRSIECVHPFCGDGSESGFLESLAFEKRLCRVLGWRFRSYQITLLGGERTRDGESDADEAGYAIDALLERDSHICAAMAALAPDLAEFSTNINASMEAVPDICSLKLAETVRLVRQYQNVEAVLDHSTRDDLDLLEDMLVLSRNGFLRVAPTRRVRR